MSATVVLDVLELLAERLGLALVAEGVPVFLGPPLTEAPLPECLIIGWDAASDDGRAASLGQDWHDLGVDHSRREEDGSVIAVIWVQSGDQPFPVLLDEVRRILTVVQDVLRADPALGHPDLLYVDLSTADVFMGTQDMNVVRLPLRFSFRALI